MQCSWWGSASLRPWNWQLLALKLFLVAVALVGAVLAAALLLTLLTTAALFAGGIFLSYHALRWALAEHSPAVNQLPSGLRRIAQAIDSDEAYLLAATELYRLCDEALSVDLTALPQRGRRRIRRVAREAHALTSLLQVMAQAGRHEAQAAAQVKALWDLAETAQMLSRFTAHIVKLRTMGLSDLWRLERERASLIAARDRLLADLVSRQSRGMRPHVLTSTRMD